MTAVDGSSPYGKRIAMLPKHLLPHLQRFRVLLSIGAGLFCSSPTTSHAQGVGDCLPVPASARAWYSGDDGVLNRVTGRKAWTQGSFQVPGKVGDAYRFTEGAHAIEPSILGWTPGPEYAIECWVRRLPLEAGGTGTWGTAIEGSPLQFRLSVGPAGEIEFLDRAKGQLVTGPVLGMGSWHHVAVVAELEGGRLYVDGELVSTAEFSIPGPVRLFNGILLGSDQPRGTAGGAVLGGDLDEVMFHDASLSEEAVRAAFLAGERGRCGPDLSVVSFTGTQFLDVGGEGEWECVVKNVGGTRTTSRGLLGSLPGFPSMDVTVNGAPAVVLHGAVQLPDLDPGETARVRFKGRPSAIAQALQVEMSLWSFLGEVDTATSNDRRRLTLVVNGPCVTGPAGPVAWLPLDATGRDPISGRPWSIGGGIKLVPGVVGEAMEFTGAGSVRHAMEPGPTPSFALEAWVNPSGDESAREVIASAGGPDSAFRFLLGRAGPPENRRVPWNAGRLLVRLPASAGLPVDGTGWTDTGAEIAAGQWSHVMVEVFPGAIRVAVNGVQTLFRVWTTTLPGWERGPLLLGAGFPGETELGQPFRGRIDEVLVHRGELGSGNWVSAYAAGSAGRCRGDLSIQWMDGAGRAIEPGIPEWLRLRVANPGPLPMSGAAMDVTLPSALELNQRSASRGTIQSTTNFGAHRLYWSTAEPLEPGAVVEIGFRVTASRSATNTVTARCWAATSDGNPGNNQASLELVVHPGNVVLDLSSLPEGESGTNIVLVPARLQRPVQTEVRVDAVIAEGDGRPFRAATPGVDFLPGRQTLVFSPTVQTQWVQVEIVGDRIREGTEAFQIRWENLSGVSVSSLSHRATIRDDEPVPRAMIGAARVVEGTGSNRILQFPVTLSNPSEVPVTLQYYTTNRTARAGTDYIAKSGSVPLRSGTPAFIEIDVLGDAEAEATEWFQLMGTVPALSSGELLPPVGGGVGIIEDDDGEVAGRIALLGVDPLPETAVPGAGIPVTVRALDERRQPAAAGGERVRFRWHRGPGRPSPVMLAEVLVESEGGVELQSTVSKDVSLEGWRVTMYSFQSWPMPTAAWKGASTNVLGPLGTLLLIRGNEPGLAGGVDWSRNQPTLKRPVAVTLHDPAGNLVDLFTSGTATPSVMQMSPATPDAEWPGFEDGLRHQAGPTRSFQRRGASLRGSADDWHVALGTPGLRNRSILLPMVAASAAPLPAGETELGADGVGKAMILLPAEPGEWTLVAEAANGRMGISSAVATRAPAGVGLAAFDVPDRLFLGSSVPVPLRLVVTNRSGSPVSNVIARMGRMARGEGGAVADLPFGSNSIVRTPVGSAAVLGTNDAGGARIEVALGRVDPGAAVEVLVDAVLAAGASSIMWATVSADGVESDPTDNVAVVVPFLSGSHSSGPELTSWWRLEGNLRDVYGGPGLGSGGDARLLDGGGLAKVALGGEGYLEVPATYPSPRAGVSELRLGVWFRTRSFPEDGSTEVLVSRPDATGSGAGFELVMVDGRVELRTGAASQRYGFGGDLRDGEWHYLSLWMRLPVPNRNHADLGVTVDNWPGLTTTLPADAMLIGAGVPVRIGGAPGRAGIRGEVAEVAYIEGAVLSPQSLSAAPDFHSRTRIRPALHAEPWFTAEHPATQRRPFEVALLVTNVGRLVSSNFTLTLPPRPDLRLLSMRGLAGIEPLPDGSQALHFGEMMPGEVQRIDLTFQGDTPQEPLIGVRWTGHPLNSGGGGFRNVVIAPDTDGDGLHDAWERAFGLDPSSALDARLDPDGDGVSTLGEYEAGTRPLDAGSVLKVEIVRELEGGLAFEVETQPGRRYELQRLELGVLSNPWVTRRGARGTGGRMRFGEPAVDGSGALFRVRVIPDR